MTETVQSKRADIKRVLVIGSGPIIIGQAAEFDYAGTQACRALKEEGLEVVLINSNPATIMTDKAIADAVYIEPLNIEFAEKVIAKERPDALLPTLGGQVGLNLATELYERGILEKYGIKLLGTGIQTIRDAEDRQSFKDKMAEIGEPCVASKVVDSYSDAAAFAAEIGYPVVVRPAYTLGGTGGGIAYNDDDLRRIAGNGLRLSRVHQVLIEACISGYKEIEFEVMRDGAGNVITVCSMENVDAVGVHTGDSVVVAPAQTLSNRMNAILKKANASIITALGVEGGCNIQYAVHPTKEEYALIEVNPRLSRSSALASKATGFPIAKVATKIAIGYTLDEIRNNVTGTTYASFEPAIDYVVLKYPRWPFDKFVHAERSLGTQMKATGEVMSIATTIEGAFMKAVRSLEQGIDCMQLPQFANLPTEDILGLLAVVDDNRMFAVAEAIRRGFSIGMIYQKTAITPFFLGKIERIIEMERAIASANTPEALEKIYLEAKEMEFPDKVIERLSGVKLENVVRPSAYKLVDTCAAEFDTVTQYYYGTRDAVSDRRDSDKKRVLVIGSGPIRIGQGIEFDYCSVHSVWALKNAGYETIIANCNPETVSTDFDTADRLYFEPLTPEDVEDIIRAENPVGAIVQFGGQTAIKLSRTIHNMGVPIWGTPLSGIDAAEDRSKFDAILNQLQIPRPAGRTVYTREEALEAAKALGYPVLVRPSYVLGGQGMEIAWNDYDIVEYMDIINRTVQEHPILIDKYLLGKEIEVDAICDGEDFLIPGIMEHLERAGVHSGDSISVYPPQKLPKPFYDVIVDYTRKLSRALGVVGLVNIQFVLYDDCVYVIEVNPRSSRTVPYISKVTGIPMLELAMRAVMGEKLVDMGYGTGLYKEVDTVAVKVPVFSFEKLHDVDISLGPEMKSTGEVLGISPDFSEALYKGLMASGMRLPTDEANVLITVKDSDKAEALEVARRLTELGYDLYGTAGTAQYLRQNGIKAKTVCKIGEGSPDILDAIKGGTFELVINTATKGRAQERDGFNIRRAAVELSIPCLTSIDTANAVLDTLVRRRSGAGCDVVNIAEL